MATTVKPSVSIMATTIITVAKLAPFGERLVGLGVNSLAKASPEVPLSQGALSAEYSDVLKRKATKREWCFGARIRE